MTARFARAQISSASDYSSNKSELVKREFKLSYRIYKSRFRSSCTGVKLTNAGYFIGAFITLLILVWCKPPLFTLRSIILKSCIFYCTYALSSLKFMVVVLKGSYPFLFITYSMFYIVSRMTNQDFTSRMWHKQWAILSSVLHINMLRSVISICIYPFF